MRTLLLLPLLFTIVSASQNSVAPQHDSSVTVLSFKWTRSRQIQEKLDSAEAVTAPALIPQNNRNTERSRRIALPPGTRDPIEETIEGRSAALEKIVQESRTRSSKPVDGFTYKATIKNASAKVIEIVYWEYRFVETASPTNVTRRQFLCGVNIKPDKEKELNAFSMSGQSDVISVGSLADKSKSLFDERVIINRVEYADGSIWQRKDWNYGEMKLAIARVIGTPWGKEMCRNL